MTFKTRFAPSPTGLLHIGNARSAVINWAYIKNKGGEFILRIDDTDLERSKKEYENKIKENLSWLGLSWSKTFNQSQRKNLYDKKIILLKKNKGPSFSRNYGMRISKSKYISFLDSDDGWTKDKLEKQISFMEKNNLYFIINILGLMCRKF